MAENVGQIEYLLSLDTSGLIKDAAIAEATTKKLGNSIGNNLDDGTNKANAAFAGFSRAAGVATLAVGVGLAAGIGTAIKSAGTFESSLSQLKQASSATGDQMSAMGKLAQELGKDNTLAGVTAQDAAYSMTELSKAGLSVKDTMDATRGVMSLAKAGNIDFADAAVIAASALNAFGMEGKDATKVADMLAAGANASQANLSDLAMGMQQSATVAKQFNLGLQDSVTALALFANNGIRGSDAGTSLKTMLIALAKPSKESAAAMADIGFKAYDANGQFVGLREMSIRLKAATEGLTDEQKQNTLATIFGTDAFRAAAVLADNAGTSYDNMSASVGKVGAAQEAAKAQMGAFNMALEGLSNQFSALSLQVGTYFLPMATQVITAISGGMIPAFNGLMSLLTGQVPMFTAIGVSILAYTAITGGITAATAAWTLAMGALNAVMLMNPIVLVTALAIGLGVAYYGVTQQSDATKSATDRLNSAREYEKQTAQEAADANDRLKDAQYRAEGSALAVERAERNYNDTVARYGPTSLEAREAELRLRQARDEAAKAAAEAAKQSDISRVANQKHVDAKASVAAANDAVKDSAYRAAGGYAEMAKMADAARKAQFTGKASDAKAYQDSVFSMGVPGRAAGGHVSAGSPYIVGENANGSLNRTSELFVPRTSGTIMNSKDLQSMLKGGGGNSSSVNISLTLNGIMTSGAEEERAVARRLIGRLNEELRAHGRAELGTA